MSQCDYKILSSNEIGNVLLCSDCGELIIGIGTFILKFKEDQAKIFLKALVGTREEYMEKRNLQTNKVFLKTPVNNLMIALNAQELDLSIGLLEFAFLKQEVEDLITAKT